MRSWTRSEILHRDIAENSIATERMTKGRLQGRVMEVDFAKLETIPRESRLSQGLESHHFSEQSSHNTASMLEEGDSQSSHVGSRYITPDTSLSQRIESGAFKKPRKRGRPAELRQWMASPFQSLLLAPIQPIGTRLWLGIIKLRAQRRLTLTSLPRWRETHRTEKALTL